jgi:hypothetical protein
MKEMAVSIEAATARTQSLWDRIASKEALIPVPSWHRVDVRS